MLLCVFVIGFSLYRRTLDETATEGKPDFSLVVVVFVIVVIVVLAGVFVCVYCLCLLLLCSAPPICGV